MESKPFASLSAGLLARKGTARPAMRRAYAPGTAQPSLPASVQDDLGWNDMGHDFSSAAPPPLSVVKADGRVVVEPAMRPDVVRQQDEIAERLVESEETKARIKGNVAALRPRADKAAFTLRLDPERHLRLRLACAVSNRSAQQIVTGALDAFLESQPQVEVLPSQLPAIDVGKDASRRR